ncbi:MAG: hypothetical protein BEN19_00945 [Epulopiscium sp. Nuni2H_MBin003]|nr:MAG: hypothetical protein BEN19_00945 [Epulopiscium sp. Nuni2H_MBin003]
MSKKFNYLYPAFLVGLIPTALYASTEVNIPDSNLKSAIITALNLLESDAVTDDDIVEEAELELLTTLDISSQNITDLTGLEYAVNLSELNATDNNISDITPLSELNNLSQVDLSYNNLDLTSTTLDLWADTTYQNQVYFIYDPSEFKSEINVNDTFELPSVISRLDMRDDYTLDITTENVEEKTIEPTIINESGETLTYLDASIAGQYALIYEDSYTVDDITISNQLEFSLTILDTDDSSDDDDDDNNDSSDDNDNNDSSDDDDDNNDSSDDDDDDDNNDSSDDDDDDDDTDDEDAEEDAEEDEEIEFVFIYDGLTSYSIIQGEDFAMPNVGAMHGDEYVSVYMSITKDSSPAYSLNTHLTGTYILTYTATSPISEDDIITLDVKVVVSKDPNGYVIENNNLYYLDKDNVYNPFSDVSINTAYYDSILYVTTKNFMHGISDDIFSPFSVVTVEELSDILYRMDSNNLVYTDITYKYMDDNGWYPNAKMWANSKNLFYGMSISTVDNSSLTQKDLLACLYNFATYKGYDITYNTVFANSLAIDNSHILAWALENNIIDDISSLNAFARRNSTADIIMRFTEYYLGHVNKNNYFINY